LPEAPTVLVYAARGRAGIGAEAAALAAGELFRIELEGAVPPMISALEPDTVLVVVTIRPCGTSG
jgi:hypothetical protein